MKLKEYEDRAGLRKLQENRQVMDFWREQMDVKNSQKKEDKDLEQREGQRHIQYANSVTYQQKPKNIQDSLNKSFEEFTENKKALIGDNSKNWEENDKKAADYKQFLKLQIEVKELEKARQAKAKEEADRQLIEHQKYLNEFMTVEKLRERQFKSSYAQQLSQQIAEK